MSQKMNPEIKERFIALLRSGEIKQGKHMMHNRISGSFCYLGVLCELHRREVGGEWVPAEDHDAEMFYLGESGVLPEPVFRWAGLPWDDPDLWRNAVPRQSTYWNDQGLTFSQLADMTEEQL